MLKTRILKRKKEPSIIIVGAGVAGLAAATRLIRNGFKKVKILEAENRIGGRVHSVNFVDGIVDHGAHWVHGEAGNVVYELANHLNLVNHSEDFENLQFILSNECEIDSKIGTTILETAFNILGDAEILKKSKLCLHDFIIESCRKYSEEMLSDVDVVDAFLKWLTKFECTIEGCDNLEDVSTSGLAHYKVCPGDSLLNWKGQGYGTVIDLLLGKHKYQSPDTSVTPIELDDILHLNTEVQQVDWSGIGVVVKCSSGEVYCCDHLIMTVSLGVLKEQHHTLFKPSLPPAKRRAIAGLGIGTVDKVYLKFPYVWWPDACSGFSIIWLKKDKLNEEVQYSWERDIIGFYTEDGSPGTLTAWLVGAAAREMECYHSDQVLEGCYRILKKFLSFKYTIPKPVAITRSTWYSNPHFRGSYSFRSMNSDALNVSAADLAEPLKNSVGIDSVLFAGEATHSDFYSTVHGAIETGWREADNIIAMYKDNLIEGMKPRL